MAVLSLATLVAQHCLMSFVSKPNKSVFSLASFVKNISGNSKGCLVSGFTYLDSLGSTTMSI
jgi:hypothetical protein